MTLAAGVWRLTRTEGIDKLWVSMPGSQQRLLLGTCAFKLENGPKRKCRAGRVGGWEFEIRSAVLDTLYSDLQISLEPGVPRKECHGHAGNLGSQSMPPTAGP